MISLSSTTCCLPRTPLFVALLPKLLAGSGKELRRPSWSVQAAQRASAAAKYLLHHSGKPQDYPLPTSHPIPLPLRTVDAPAMCCASTCFEGSFQLARPPDTSSLGTPARLVPHARMVERRRKGQKGWRRFGIAQHGDIPLHDLSRSVGQCPAEEG